MKTTKQNFAFGKRQLDTLGQSGTPKLSNQIIKETIVINGNGRDISNTEVLQGLAKRKVITNCTILGLIKVAEKKGNYSQAKLYWDAYYCQSKIFTSRDRLHTKYCKLRFCNVCCAIRKAELINEYFDIVYNWEKPFFLTLTAQSVPAYKLKSRINNMIRAFRILLNRNKKRNQRDKGIKLMGIKSLECNFNPIKRTYNPHFHLIVPNKEIADLFKKEWLELWTGKGNIKYIQLANEKGQYAKKVFNKEKCLMEVVKYFTKIFTDPEMKAKSKKKDVSPFVYLSAMDNIFCAMNRHRIFDRFGFNLTTIKKKRESKTQYLNQYQEWWFDPKLSDWINSDNGKKLTGYIKPPTLDAILETNLDTELQ